MWEKCYDKIRLGEFFKDRKFQEKKILITLEASIYIFLTLGSIKQSNTHTNKFKPPFNYGEYRASGCVIVDSGAKTENPFYVTQQG